MRKVKMLQDYGCWKKGIHIMDNNRAKFFCKKRIDWDYYERKGTIRLIPTFALELEDLGLHFGHSKFDYVKNKPSKIGSNKGDEK